MKWCAVAMHRRADAKSGVAQVGEVCRDGGERLPAGFCMTPSLPPRRRRHHVTRIALYRHRGKKLSLRACRRRCAPTRPARFTNGRDLCEMCARRPPIYKLYNILSRAWVRSPPLGTEQTLLLR